MIPSSFLFWWKFFFFFRLKFSYLKRRRRKLKGVYGDKWGISGKWFFFFFSSKVLFLTVPV
jgi:hypothetical protein